MYIQFQIFNLLVNATVIRSQAVSMRDGVES